MPSAQDTRLLPKDKWWMYCSSGVYKLSSNVWALNDTLDHLWLLNSASLFPCLSSFKLFNATSGAFCTGWAPPFEPQETVCSIKPAAKQMFVSWFNQSLTDVSSCYLFCLNLKWSALICHLSSRKKSSGWCTCGLSAETRKSSTRTLPGDYWISPPRARSRSSKTLWCALNTHSQGGGDTHRWTCGGRTLLRKHCGVVLLKARAASPSIGFAPSVIPDRSSGSHLGAVDHQQHSSKVLLAACGLSFAVWCSSAIVGFKWCHFINMGNNHVGISPIDL